MSNQSFQYIEDNGGGLFLFVFQGDKLIDGIGNLEYAQPGEWLSVKGSLMKNPKAEVSGWDGHIDNFSDVYEEFRNDDFGSKLVADQDGIYLSRMGRAAQIYFGVDEE